ncbi:hypothetical protein HYW83_01290 [Candidatus Peregrinibacteria bacterium]|nr:hypothetical protein [Candidatus Peregrinibacteria bacterium]
MSFARIQATFLRLPKHIKMIGIGSLVLLISTILPWYADLDSYRIGDQFLGITGPASFVGIAILLLSGLSLWIFSYHLFERHVPRLPVREAILHLAVSIESLFLLVLVNSIYFHPKFGVNITLKETRFGMTVAFIGAVVLLIGGYLQNKEEIAKTDDVGKLEPLIKMEPAPSQPQAYAPTARPSESLTKQIARPQPRKILPQHAHERGFFFGERGQQILKKEEPRPSLSEAKPLVRPEGATLEKTEEAGGGSYKIRMDL